MKILVISLPARSDRYDLFKKHWDWLSPIERIDGQISEIPHTGCGLAHCKAIKKGLENHDICLVLEDDARLSCSRSNLIEVLTEIRNYKNKYDAIILGPVFDSANPAPPDTIYKVSDNFMRCSSTKSIESATAVVWFRSALPLLDNYEQLIKEKYIFPIDRMLTTFYWTASDTVGWHKPFTPIYPYACMKIQPRVLISNKCLIYQQPNLISDNTKKPSENLLKKSDEYLGRIYRDKALTNNI